MEDNFANIRSKLATIIKAKHKNIEVDFEGSCDSKLLNNDSLTRTNFNLGNYTKKTVNFSKINS